MYSDRSVTDKNHPGQKSPQTKPSRQNSLDKPPPVKDLRELRRMYSCITKNWGSERCDVAYFRGIRRYVTNCNRGRGSKLVQNVMLYGYVYSDSRRKLFRGVTGR